MDTVYEMLWALTILGISLICVWTAALALSYVLIALRPIAGV